MVPYRPGRSLSHGGAAFIVAGGMLVAVSGCDGSRSPSPSASETADAGSVVQPGSGCLRPEEGCPCDDGAAPVTCYLPAESRPEGLLCRRGTLSCRDGTWSACESIQSYTLRREAALITEPTTCNPCRPDCFETLDRPTTEDLGDANSSNVEYDPDLGGIRITSTVPDPPVDQPLCGDGLLEAPEQCDDGNQVSGDGCSATCHLEAGWVCDEPGEACRRTVCGDGIVEGTEQCDDGNLEIGDGCTPQCTLEPDCSAGTCEPLCGDGEAYPGQECDDGNLLDGDGCSSECIIEEGFDCEIVPDSKDVPIVYRDFRADHPDFEDWCCGLDEGMVEFFLGPDGKPVPIVYPLFNWLFNPSLTTEENFNEWYNDVDANITIPDALTLALGGDDTHVFDDGTFFPIDGMGWTLDGEPEPHGHNYHFTSELRFWFVYEPGQRLDFRGDDDVWVFINGRRAVDIGGVHGPISRGITLDADTDWWLDLTPGGLYEVAVFHAERHTSGSNYRLSLDGFFAGRSECTPICGDGIVTLEEVCDDGINDGSPGSCMPDCQAFAPWYQDTGRYWRDYDATETCEIPPMRPDWGELSWEVQTPSDSRIRFEIRTAPTAAGIASATPVTFTVPAEQPEVGSVDVTQLLVDDGQIRNEPHLRVTAVLIASSDEAASPVLHEFTLQFACRDAE
jgi:fibro-slime domain-containing protein